MLLSQVKAKKLVIMDFRVKLDSPDIMLAVGCLGYQKSGQSVSLALFGHKDLFMERLSFCLIAFSSLCE